MYMRFDGGKIMKNIPGAYEVIKEEQIDDIRSKGLLLRHKKKRSEDRCP